MDTSKSAQWRSRVRVPNDAIGRLLEQRFRLGNGRIVAALTRRFGADRLPIVENAVQDAYVRALERWSRDGIPSEPERWLIRVAHNATVDALRRERATEPIDLANEIQADPPAFDADDELRLMFLCCTPSLTQAAQVALVLSVAFGLSARQIALAFLSDERTVAQRLVRAKQRLRDERVRFEVPDAAELPARLVAILDVLYVVFSEGYNPTESDTFDRGLCDEALRLIRLITEANHIATPSAFALRALVCFHASRLPARLADDGSLLLMAEQDRTRWDAALLSEAFWCLEDAGVGNELTRFHLEAAIAACHALGSTYATTDWGRIVELYDMLRARAPSFVVDVNRALAKAMLSGAQVGLDELDAIPERDVLARYPYALAAYADLHASLGNLDQARRCLDRALDHQAAPSQRALLQRKRAALERSRQPVFGTEDSMPIAGSSPEWDRTSARAVEDSC